MFFSQTELSLELLGIFKIKREKGEQKSAKPRSYDALSIRLSGSALFKTESKKIKAEPGGVLYIPKNELYSQCTDGETILVIHFFNYSFNQKNSIDLLCVDDAEYIKNTVSEMYDIWKQQAPGFRYKCTALLYSLLYYLNIQSQKSEVNTALDKKLQSAVNYIHANYRTQNISIASLAKACAVSQTYFRKTFKEIYKATPLEFINNLKLEYASQLLQSKLYTISEASEKSGFNDSKYFSRLFKKRYGISPAKYKNTDLEKEWK